MLPPTHKLTKELVRSAARSVDMAKATPHFFLFSLFYFFSFFTFRFDCGANWRKTGSNMFRNQKSETHLDPEVGLFTDVLVGWLQTAPIFNQSSVSISFITHQVPDPSNNEQANNHALRWIGGFWLEHHRRESSRLGTFDDAIVREDHVFVSHVELLRRDVEATTSRTSLG